MIDLRLLSGQVSQIHSHLHTLIVIALEVVKAILLSVVSIESIDGS